MSFYFLKPALKETIWGGRKLIEDFGFKTDLSNIAEAWMFSCHQDGQSTVVGGEYDGLTLWELIESLGVSCLGSKCECKDIEDFPILIKLIDASDDLSIQVHPDNDYAKAHEKDIRGKTEAWYIINSDDGELIYGFKEDISKDDFKKSIEEDSLLEKVNRVKVKNGDVAFIPSGTLHAIGKNILLAEVQQSCNTTYRVYDYNRLGKDGKPRELNVEKAIDVTRRKKETRSLSPFGATERFDGCNKTTLIKCEYFETTLVDVKSEFKDYADLSSFLSLIVLEGDGEIKSLSEKKNIKKGDSIFIPAGEDEYTVKGNVKILKTSL